MKPNKSCVRIFIEENRTLHMELHQLQPNSQFHSDAMPLLLWRHLVVSGNVSVSSPPMSAVNSVPEIPITQQNIQNHSCQTNF
jgi:hypothetical protein